MNLSNEYIQTFIQTKEITDEALKLLLQTSQYDTMLIDAADKVRREVYGDAVYIRGLIEVSNYCKNNCYYCGIRAGNNKVTRYRLSKEDILACCKEGYKLGFRTFVLQGGEDPYFTDEVLCDWVGAIRKQYPDCAITLSLGERSKESYQALFDAGANRYLLRHETADAEHYGKLHPEEMLLETRKQSLFALKEIGYQVGSGFMVGSPYQTLDFLVKDIRFLQELKPDMIGIGPYLTHLDTPFRDFPNGSFDLTIRLIAILRILFPWALIPATTALGTIRPDGREEGLKAGANVVMPNLSPVDVRKLYALYENKISTGEEAAQGKKLLEERVRKAGYRVVTDVGHVKK